MMTKAKIKDIAFTSAGYTFRGAIKASSEGKILVLQAQDISKKEYFSSVENLSRTMLDIPRSNSYLRYNDVLIVSRGSRAGSFKSTVFKLKNENVVASSSVNIIRIKDDKVLPEFLSMYLNSAEGQRLLSNILSGAYIKSILRKDLENLVVPLPPMERQKVITALHENIRRQETISDQISHLKKNIMDASIKHLITS